MFFNIIRFLEKEVAWEELKINETCFYDHSRPSFGTWAWESLLEVVSHTEDNVWAESYQCHLLGIWITKIPNADQQIMELEGALPCSQVHTTGPFPEPDK
jgi:hypothetical protein